MTPKKLIESGYKEFDVPRIKRAQRAFQKRFWDGEDTKYFITVYYYNHSYIGLDDFSFDVDLQFYKIYKGKEITVNITLFGMFDFDAENEERVFFDIDFVEDYVEELFLKNEFEYYKKY